MADRTSLSRATEPSDSPTPGYLYLDIAKSAASSPQACAETATWLTRRLSTKQNHNIKYKCLKVIAQITVSPVTRGQFKRVISQDAAAVGAVKEALQFRGPPDAVRGDEIYARVRAAAKEALDAIYSDEPSSTNAVHSYASAGISSSSYGSSVGGGGGGYGGPSSSSSGMDNGPRRMEGIGNPMYKDPRNESQGSSGIGGMTIGEVAAVAGETLVGMIKDPLAKNVPDPPRHGGGAGGGGMQGYGAPRHGSYGGSAPPFAAEIARSTGGEYSGASNRGPNAIGAPNNYDRDSSYYKKPSNYDWAKQSSSSPTSSAAAPSGVGGSWGVAAAAAAPGGTSIASQARQPPLPNRNASYGAPSSSSGTIGTATGGVASTDGSYEKNLIMDLCPPGGMKAEPPSDKLSAYVRSVPSLNSDLICPALLDCLEDGQPWIIKAKALCVIEATIKAAKDASMMTGGGDGANAYSDFFYECGGEIEPLASHARPAIRDPAKRVLKLLGIEITGEVVVSSASGARRRATAPPAAVAATVEPPNLLDFGDDDDAAAGTAPPAAPVPTTTGGSSSLFGGLTTKAPVSQQQQQQQQQQTQSIPQTDNVELLLGDPTPSTTTTTATTNSASPAVVVGGGGGGGGGDLFGDVTVKVNTVSTTTTTAAAADSSNVGGGIQDVASATASSGSAFGFINGGSNNETAAPAPASPSRNSFDPLTSPTSSSSANNASQMSAQMQAMAYQQNMMMMQQQMQQMQMAMAMQQQHATTGGGGGANMMRQSMPARIPGSGHHHHPMNPNVMSAHLMKQAPGRMDASSSFSFLDGGSSSSAAKKNEIKSFDFVKDAMKDAK